MVGAQSTSSHSGSIFHSWAHFNSHIHVCNIWASFAAEDEVKLTYRLGEGCCNNLKYNKPSVNQSFMTSVVFSAPSSQDMGWRHRGCLPVPMPPSSPSQHPPCRDPSHHILSTGNFFHLTTSSRTIKGRYFLVVSPLLLVKVLHNQGNQKVFTLSGIFSDICKQ